MRSSAGSELPRSGSQRSRDSTGVHEHAVHFYQSDEVLVEAVRSFLVAGLESGEPCIVIGTAAHCQAFSLALAAHGVDVERARASRQLTLCDAHQTLDKITAGGVLEPAAFRREAIAIIESVRDKERGGRVRLYGEMVDLLWQAGKRSMALELETLWNDLALEYDYSILCGYLFGNFHKATDADEFERVCRLHSHIVSKDGGAADRGPEVVELTLLRQRAYALEHEIQQRNELQHTLHKALADLSNAEDTLRENQRLLETIEQLMKITGAIADAASEVQVLDAIVYQTAAALGASTAGLWVTDHDGRAAVLLRCFGYPDGVRTRFSEVSLDTGPRFPALDVLCNSRPIFIGSQAELLERYPHLATTVTQGRSYSVACLPLAVEGSRLGALALSFDNAPPIDEDQRKLLMLVARYSSQVLARLHLFEAERRSRALSEASAARTRVISRRAEVLHDLAKAIIVAERMESVLEAALDASAQALDTSRASILVFDSEGVLRLEAWRGLSEDYRRTLEGSSTWSRDANAQDAILIHDVELDPRVASHRPSLQREGIAAMAFIPLVASGRVVGTFMVYYNDPRELPDDEVATARAIANHLAAAVARFAAVDELRRTVHFNEVFAGVLGHDLRNPLGAIMIAAELALKRDESERLAKPLSRILTSGARMARMIDQLLDFTRARVGAGIPLAPRALDLSSVVRQVMDELEEQHPQCRLRLELEGDATGVWDADRLSQVFSNLVGNAVQHGAREHGVGVLIDGSDRAQVRVAVRNVGKISREILPRLFEPMTGALPRRENAQGLGLGLYISQQIMKAHGGRIDVQSTDLETTFSVFLPRLAKSPDSGKS